MEATRDCSQHQAQAFKIPRKPVPSRDQYENYVGRVVHYTRLPQNSDPGQDERLIQSEFGADIAEIFSPLHSSLLDPNGRENNVTEVDEQQPLGQRESFTPRSFAKADRHCQTSVPHGWLPYTLRRSYLLPLIAISLGLSAAVGFLTWYSTAYMGLGDDSNSTVVLFGWRFSPTLIAVLYVLLETTLLVDVRRTEIFARLTQNNASSALSTLLHGVDSWWDDPYEALKKQEDNAYRGWALFWASIASIIGMLVISPLSAGLLSTGNVQIKSDASFHQIAAFQNSPLVASADDATYVRTIATSALGLTTSAWLNDQYALLPFWPSTLETAPLGSMLATSAQTWYASTTIFQVIMDCKPMWLSEAIFQPSKFTEPPPYELSPSGYVPDYYTIQLTSVDGCIYEYAVSSDQDEEILFVGGGWWSNTSDRNYTLVWGTSSGSDPNKLDGPSFAVASSPKCDGRDIFFVTSPFKNQSTQAAGQICSSNYYQADIETTVVIDNAKTSVSFDEGLFRARRRPISPSFDVNAFELLFHGPQWATKFQPPNYQVTRPVIGGPLLTIAALHNWNLEDMMSNSSIVQEAMATKQRFFGEALQKAFATIGAENATEISGSVALLRTRIVVNFAIGVTLAALLLCSAIMFTMVLFYSRPKRRSLGVLRDPKSAAAVASLVGRQDVRAYFQNTDRVEQSALRASLSDTWFRLRNGVLSPVNRGPRSEVIEIQKEKAKDWRPAVLRGWSGASAIVFMSILTGGLISLFVESYKTALYETFFVYQKSFSIGKGITADIAPYSIIPTLFAVMVKLWWGALESTFKRLQPYISMTRQPAKSGRGITLSYVDSVMLWASWKAAKHRHWLLASITIGAFLAEVFTVGMSALWNRESAVLSRAINATRHLELRTIPQIFATVIPNAVPEGNTTVKSISVQTDGTVLNGWLYGGLVTLVYNGSRPSWTSDDNWAFAPVELSSISVPNVQTIGSNSSTENPSSHISAANVTVDTPALRARLECTRIDLSNISRWLKPLDFTNQSNWNMSTIPPNLKTGYSLSATEDGFFPIDDGPNSEAWKGNSTTFFVDDHRITCCANETSGTPGQAAIGYWSMNAHYDYALVTNFTIKWIVGELHDQQVQLGYLASSQYDQFYYTLWGNIPRMTALNCMPVFETADAEVTVDISSSTVQHYTLKSSPMNSTAAWTDPWLSHTNFTTNNTNTNLTISYGWLFLQALLTAADTTGIGASSLNDVDENTNDRTFNFRQTGLNADFMSYAALQLLENDAEALLDPDIMFKTSNHVFGTFFQQFVAGNVSSQSGSAGFQPINATVPWDLGPAFKPNNSVTLNPYQDRNDTGHLSGTVNATLHIRIEHLHMSPTAVYLCLAILVYLIAVTSWVYTKHRQYFKALPRDVDSLASVIGFVYGSPKLLQWVEEHKFEEDWGLTKENGDLDGPSAKMGWFDGDHWGIELVDDAVDGHEVVREGHSSE